MRIQKHFSAETASMGSQALYKAQSHSQIFNGLKESKLKILTKVLKTVNRKFVKLIMRPFEF